MSINLVNPRPDSTNWSPILRDNFNATEILVNQNEQDILDNSDNIDLLEATTADHETRIGDNEDDIGDNFNAIAINTAALGSHYRGQPGAYDFQVGDFNTNGAWHDLDLSDIVPAGTTTVDLSVYLRDDLVTSTFYLNQKGGTSSRYASSGTILVANLFHPFDWTITVDADRILSYFATNTTWTTINLTVKAYLLGA